MEKINTFLIEALAMASQLVSWRRDLHQRAELGTTLPQTMAYIRSRLEEMDIPFKYHESISCMEATIGTGERCFLLRSDVDALPMAEETELPFKSTNGCMHSCGHDLHGTILLGAAKLLKTHEQELCGTVKLLFQSGEEVFQGARAAVEAGVLENPRPSAAFAAHVSSTLPVGVILTGKEPMASVDGFKITLIGHGGHGSLPKNCIDPINAAVQVYLALQSLIAREIGGTEEAVLTIGQLTAGDAANIIPERAVLQGTLRTFKPKVRQRLASRIREISAGIAAAYRCQFQYEVLSQCPSVVTDDAVTAGIEASIQKVVPRYRLTGGAHGMGSEDFAEISSRIPSGFFMLGAGHPDPEKRLGQHNPRVEFNENILPVGAAIYAQAAMDYLKGEE